MKKRNGYIKVFKSNLLTSKELAYHSYWCTVSAMAITLILLIGFLGGVVLFDTLKLANALKLAMLSVPIAFFIDSLLIRFVAPKAKTVITQSIEGLFFDVWIGNKLVNQLKIKSIEYWQSSPVGHSFDLNNHGVKIEANWTKSYISSIACAIIEDEKGRKIQLFEALNGGEISMVLGQAPMKLTEEFKTYPVKNLLTLITKIEDALAIEALNTLRLAPSTAQDILELKAIEE